MFNFRIINTPDGNQIIDKTQKTPYSALTPTQMLEYAEVDNQITYMDRIERKRQAELKHKNKWYMRLANACGWWMQTKTAYREYMEE